MFETPVIDERIWAIAPGFQAISIHVDATSARQGTIDTNLLPDACEFVAAGGPTWAEVHLASWSDAYLRFGAKPNRTPCSAQALRKRVLKDGRISAINPIVDLYNAVSLRYAIPVGGENYDAYVGLPCLTVAEGDEIFETVMNGEAVNDPPTPGEVIWRDNAGVTCRRWNWRQGTRTRLDTATGRMWFVLEALETMPADALAEATNAMSEGLEQLMPGCRVLTRRIPKV
ncbi:B3/4 domain-containing protein [Pararhizobium sp. YC-54]|uniref:B3/B4 domain-containing protein n=1 Tax=Pararhizobium sp. YC-54 TaxID=2986920 RepID=UPI0021F6C900|nr:B3/4 domain-containing protein [Pararhizobium sp. YC-54]MCW0001783.1 B3/4 domain-containing protein [Pararhizobium sp. YC-54]